MISDSQCNEELLYVICDTVTVSASPCHLRPSDKIRLAAVHAAQRAAAEQHAIQQRVTLLQVCDVESSTHPHSTYTDIHIPLLFAVGFLHCFYAVGWVAGRASSMYRTEWWDSSVVVCLGRGADLHMAQQMPLSLTISCSSKSTHACTHACMHTRTHTHTQSFYGSSGF